MQVRAPLMIEHRLIERMLALINKEAIRVRKTKVINPVFIDNAVDFIRVYADKTHHGKEEDILFRDLAQKDMTSEEQKIMGELIQEHVLGRKTGCRPSGRKEAPFRRGRFSRRCGNRKT